MRKEWVRGQKSKHTDKIVIRSTYAVRAARGGYVPVCMRVSVYPAALPAPLRSRLAALLNSIAARSLRRCGTQWRDVQCVCVAPLSCLIWSGGATVDRVCECVNL